MKSVFGKPDIAFIGKKIAVFCDSEFWHGYNWEERKKVVKRQKKDVGFIFQQVVRKFGASGFEVGNNFEDVSGLPFKMCSVCGEKGKDKLHKTQINDRLALKERAVKMANKLFGLELQ